MAKFKLLGFAIIIASFIASCDLSVPDKPDFTTAHTVEIPIINNKTYVFLGDSTGALIDSTSEDLDSLFVVDPTSGLISITTEEEFDFGSLDDAIPEIDGSSTSFNSEVGEIQIGDFASGDGGSLGEASFQNLTGTGFTPSSGDPVPPQPAVVPEVTIDLDTDFFQSATFKSGDLVITLTNDLGFDLSDIIVTLISDPDNITDNGDEVDVVTSNSGVIVDQASETITLPLDGQQLANPQVEVSIRWNTPQNFQRDPNALIVNSASGSELFASSVTAKIEAQDFGTSNTSSFSDTGFRFTDASHYVELSAGQISITDLLNDTGIALDTLQISFPDIRDADTDEPLVIDFSPLQNSPNAVSRNIDLTGYRIYALNNEVTYQVNAVTENTQSGPGERFVTISETDQINASVDISGLAIESAFGIVLAQTVLLGDNDVSNDTGSEILDVFNDNEAEVTTIDGLDEFSDQIDGFKFTEPIININYTSNIKIETTIYAALVGVDADGNTVYLSGNAGGPNEVTASDPISGLVANGQQLLPEQLVKFSIDNVSDCQNNTCQISFNINTTNVDDFLNNLPSDIRFVGRAVVNESENEASISTPLEFNPGLNVDLPLAFRTELGNPANYTDTTDVSLDLGEDTDITEGQIFFLYTNDLPIGLNVFLSFQDSTNNELFTLPNPGNEYRLVASPVDDVTGFATGGQENNSFVATLTEDQLRLLKTADIVEFSINLRSSENKAVRLRASDSFRISLGARIKIENKFGGK